MPHGSDAGPGPRPQAACATTAAARSGREAGTAPSQNRAAGSGHQGAGDGAGPWRTGGIKVPGKCIPALRTQCMWGCTFPRTQPLGRSALLGPSCVWLTLWERLMRLSPKQARWEAQWAERKLAVALMWAQASCKLGLIMDSSWEPQAGNVSSSQL